MWVDVMISGWSFGWWTCLPTIGPPGWVWPVGNYKKKSDKCQTSHDGTTYLSHSLFIPLSVSLTMFEGHSSVLQF